ILEVDGAVIKTERGWPPLRLDDAGPIEGGIYRIRLAVWPYQPGDRTLAIAVYNGSLFTGLDTELVGIYAVTGTSDEPRIIEAVVRMREGGHLKVEPIIYPRWDRKSDEPRPGVAVAWAETEGPLDQAWPSEAQTRLMGPMPMKEGPFYWMRHRKGV